MYKHKNSQLMREELPIDKQYKMQYKITSIIVVAIRGLIFSLILFPLLFIQHYLVPLIVFPLPRRYISCVLNLLGCRILMMILGFFRFQSQNFRFFQRDSLKFTLKSGFIGIAFHKNIIDFMYYSYLFTPIFTRMIIHIKSSGEREILYCPLTYLDSWKAALSFRGFQPLIVRSNQQIRRLKCRKMAMNKLVSESFEEILGPILVLLPGMDINQNIQIDQILANDIYANEILHRRSGVGFSIQYYPNQMFNRTYMNQASLILKLIEKCSINKLNIRAITFGKYKNQYFNKQSFSKFINKLYSGSGSGKKKWRNILYEDYVEQVTKKERLANKLQQKEEEKKIYQEDKQKQEKEKEKEKQKQKQQ